MLYPAVAMNLETIYKNRDKAYCYGSCMLELLSLDSSFVKKNNKKRFRDTLPFDVKKADAKYGGGLWVGSVFSQLLHNSKNG